MEEINLASSSLGATICCSTPSRDDHPSSSLLEGGAWMADYFIKSPVNLVIHLPCPVILHSVSWGTRVGSHSCSLHEVWATAEEGRCGQECTNPGPGDTQPGAWHQVGRGRPQDNQSTPSTHSSQSSQSSPWIGFYNRCVCVGGGPPSGLRLSCASWGGLLARVTMLRLTVVGTEGASVPCATQLRITGTVARNIRDWRHKERNILAMAKLTPPKQSKQTHKFSFFGSATEEDEEVEVIEEPRVIKSSESVSEDCPTDFLDAITVGVMSLPYTLPSGHNVDRSTLDKCQENFASWGGPPRDPFTGTLFSANCKPLFNAGLKARIDAWLLANNRSPGPQGRTLGSATAIQRFLEAKGQARPGPGPGPGPGPRPGPGPGPELRLKRNNSGTEDCDTSKVVIIDDGRIVNRLTNKNYANDSELIRLDE